MQYLMWAMYTRSNQGIDTRTMLLESVMSTSPFRRHVARTYPSSLTVPRDNVITDKTICANSLALNSSCLDLQQ
jgi:hypothetical protein